MKENHLSQTKNVKRALGFLNMLIARPRTEMVGLGLFYGETGFGKTRFAKAIAKKQGYLYLELEATMSVRSFAHRLLQLLCSGVASGVASEFKGTTNETVCRIIDHLHRNPNTVIFIDELNKAFEDKAILGTIRDIVDKTTATIVLFGTHDSKERLERANQYYFDRCMFFYQFEILAVADYQLICDEVCDVKIVPQVVKVLCERTEGHLRRLIKGLAYLEAIAKQQNLSEIGVDFVGKLQGVV